MAQKMRAVDVKDGKGPPSALFINPDVEKPIPKPTECLVRIHAFGLNRADTLQREGMYPVPPGVTHIMGLEFSGVIEEVGSSQDTDKQHEWKKGDEVFGLAYGGTYAEFVAISKRMLMRKPKELSWECCAGTPEVWMTALQALHVVGGYDPTRVKSILWHAGASSVSIAGIQLSFAAHEHAQTSSYSSAAPKVFATARQDEKCDFCVKTLGATGAVNTTKHENWAEEIRKLNDGKGVDLVIDFVGASYFQQNIDVLERDGRMVQLGLMGGSILPNGTDISGFLRKRLRYEGSTLRSRDPDYQSMLRDLFEEKVLPDMLAHKFKTHVDVVMDWKDIGKAHEMLERNATKGKIVCKIS